MRPSALLPLLLLVPGIAAAQIGGGGAKADPRVATALRSIGVSSEIDDDQDYKLVLDVDDDGDRTQIVYIISSTERYGNLEIREIWAPAFKTGGRLDADVARKMLAMNERMKLGAWRLYGEGDDQMAVYAVQIDADANAEAMRSALRIVVQVADAEELTQTGKDDY
ncbi:MAG TPA: YbjN domain-containing protein [Gemmatimonadales bacterium]